MAVPSFLVGTQMCMYRGYPHMGPGLAQCVVDAERLPPFLTEPIFKE